MAFLGCESATGAAGDPGDGRDLAQNFTITPAQKIVVPDGSTKWEFYPWYGGINITTKDQIVWSVTGDDQTSTNPGFKAAGTTIASGPASGNGVLYVDKDEKSVYLTVTASYGGYLVSEKVEVGVPYLTGSGPGVPALIPGVEIGTTNVSWPGYAPNPANDPTKPDSTYLVYTIDSKKVPSVSRTAKIPLEATVKVNTGGAPGVDYDIPLPQDKWLTIYEVPLATGAGADGHTTILGFRSLQAVESNALVHVNLPRAPIVGAGAVAVPYPILMADPELGTGKFTYSGSPLMFKGETSDSNGGYPTTYTAYLVYYSPYDPITGEKLPLDDYVPALNTTFVPGGDFRNINNPLGGTVTLNKTGEWYYILQYTGMAPGTGTGAWSYVPATTNGYSPGPVSGTTTVTVKDPAKYSATVIKPEGAVNTVHIGLSGDRTFVDEYTLQDHPEYFGLATAYAQITRDNDTGVTLYLTNGDRTTFSTVAAPPITINEEAFRRGAAPKIDDTVNGNAFITVSGSDMKYSDIVVSGQTPGGFTFTAGTAFQVTVASGAAFPIGNLENTYNEEPLGTIQWNISWYYVNGSNWVSTGTPNGNTFTPTEDDKGKTIGIRVDAEGNFPDVTLVEVTNQVTPLGTISKWSYIGYGQRILGAVAR
jgi:hypothetical protein